MEFQPAVCRWQLATEIFRAVPQRCLKAKLRRPRTMRLSRTPVLALLMLCPNLARQIMTACYLKVEVFSHNTFFT